MYLVNGLLTPLSFRGTRNLRRSAEGKVQSAKKHFALFRGKSKPPLPYIRIRKAKRRGKTANGG